ncbi:hypothetical protein LCGC14_1315270 [marine sediment metagenome]|uniref:Uncharacterized protein n=1 Tax=marine sediment metagenome TaxID=412755 RepID=A0A0F9KLQ5_9ZZZZ
MKTYDLFEQSQYELDIWWKTEFAEPHRPSYDDVLSFLKNLGGQLMYFHPNFKTYYARMAFAEYEDMMNARKALRRRMRGKPHAEIVISVR